MASFLLISIWLAVGVTSVRDFCILLAKSKLLPDEVEGVHRRWKEDTKGDDGRSTVP
ncbi:MAG: hypothetical protein U0792_21600 [Gemmataceae bacterium]